MNPYALRRLHSKPILSVSRVSWKSKSFISRVQRYRRVSCCFTQPLYFHDSFRHLHAAFPELFAMPRSSASTDRRENALFVPDFWNVQPDLPHGALVFSFDSAVGQCRIPGYAAPVGVEVAIVGSPMRCTWKVTND